MITQHLPCPFCGGTPVLHHGHADITYVLCDACGAVVSFRPNLKGQDAVRAWNRRAADDGVPVAVTMDDAAADPALTMESARALLRDAAAGIRKLYELARPKIEDRT